jgi:hypothetical protein
VPRRYLRGYKCGVYMYTPHGSQSNAGLRGSYIGCKSDRPAHRHCRDLVSRPARLLPLIPRAVLDDGAGDKRRRHDLAEVVGDHRIGGDLAGAEAVIHLLTDKMPEAWTAWGIVIAGSSACAEGGHTTPPAPIRPATGAAFAPDLGRLRTIIDALMTITVMPVGMGTGSDLLVLRRFRGHRHRGTTLVAELRVRWQFNATRPTHQARRGYGIASAHAICPSKPSVLAMSR